MAVNSVWDSIADRISAGQVLALEQAAVRIPSTRQLGGDRLTLLISPPAPRLDTPRGFAVWFARRQGVMPDR